jgi:hypothetical protein
MLTVLLLGYMLLWWNRGAQLNSNGLPTLAAQGILAGKVPYLDFHYWCPPGHLLIYTALTALFGDGLIYVRAFALIERTATFVLVYFWLARVVSARAAFFGTFAAGVGFSADIGDVIAHYGFDAVLASVAAGFAACVAITSKRRLARTMYFVTGIAAGVCMVAKQTQGVGVFGLFVAVFLVGGESRSPAFRIRTVLEFLAGWAVPTSMVAWWLLRAGAWQAFLNQNFVQGTASKGSLGAILVRPLASLRSQHMLAAAFLIAAGLICAYGWLSRKDDEHPASAVTGLKSPPWISWVACLLAMTTGFVWAWWLPNAGNFFDLERTLTGFSAICIFISLYGSVALAMVYSARAIRGALDAVGLQKWILASVSSVTAYMFSLSWAAFEQMLIPGFAFILALALDRQLRRPWNARAYCIAALGLVLICTATFRKLTWPYAWENWVDGPIKTETEASAFPEMRGLRLTHESAAFLSTVTNIIETHSRPDETIFCYPNYTLFYVLAHRAPGVFAYMHWFDIASDNLVRQDAQNIREHPPAVILYVDFPEDVIRRAENSFRGGGRSGQRELAATIQTLPGYRVIQSIPIPHVGYDMKIYARD